MRSIGTPPRARRIPRARIAWALLCAAPLAAGPPATSILTRWDLETGPSAVQDLPGQLTEVSGLAVSPDGRIFAHSDENGEVTELDPATGSRIARFGIGRSPVAGDFEGIAWADGRLFLITSEGTIAEFPAGRDDTRVEYRRHVTGLNRTCEVEGLAHDARAGALLVLCKRMYEGGPPGIYAFELGPMRLDPRPRHVVRAPSGDAVDPSGIVVHAETGHMLVLAARQRRIIELDASGRPVAERELRRSVHRQAEGIELLADGTLLIADEGAGRRARLSWYRPASAP